ncbi:hypothetical protein K9L67_02055 [Candidatus Woesearchaeota archaeon]|nr:hypothetical protein [Candidatus Woesearchaeota archaeon]MCF7900987.1 hypothetical protein [Candidatus Woesearchaeota archaeon]MCF8013297.1 hypothetical protein [Candidatus Woesearchaeota archaeon]
MVSITIPLEDETWNKIKKKSWINWSEIARQETKKKIIFEKFIRTGKITKKDIQYCEETDWHPVDELPLKKEFLRKLSGTKQEKSLKINSVSDIFK